MAEPRDNPYVWVSWLTSLLAGDAHCEWAAWFRAHYAYSKIPSDFDLVKWKAQHAQMVRDRVALLKSQGYGVYVEGQNKFSLRGKTATLGGCPDIVGVNSRDAVIIDCKTGNPRNSDIFQVMIYMLVLPLVGHAASGCTLRGEVHYKDRTVPISSEQISAEFQDQFRSLMARVAATNPAVKIPSYGECRFCDISDVDCPERVTNPPDEKHGAHNLF